jgi:hypothetical protein
MTSFNILLANLIYIFHILVIIFILLAPFTKIPSILILHITFSISLLVHWFNNNNICSLSLLESYLRGTDYDKSFTHKFIAPVYDISNTEWSDLCYKTVIILMSISIYFLITSPKWSEFKKCWNNIQLEIKRNNIISLSQKSKMYLLCFQSLF